jgi:hypothetical protein
MQTCWAIACCICADFFQIIVVQRLIHMFEDKASETDVVSREVSKSRQRSPAIYEIPGHGLAETLRHHTVVTLAVRFIPLAKAVP